MGRIDFPGSVGVPPAERRARLGRVDTRNLTQRRKGRKDAVIPLLFPIFTVIPAKAGIQRVAAKLATRNQV